MPTTTEDLRGYLKEFNFEGLFIEGLGWNHFRSRPLQVEIDEAVYRLQPVAEKAGFAVYVCEPEHDGSVPSYRAQQKIEHQVAKSAFEHLIVFVDAEQSRQVWQWVKREPGKSPKPRRWEYGKGQPGDSLLQRLQDLAFDLGDEAAGIEISDVTGRARRAFDVEKVTKRFYERFSTELKAFQKFIDGITDMGDRDWYASLMLNRMMFVYFIQKQGFLDGDLDYLRNRLNHLKQTGASGKFQDFYRAFLLRLFHEGLGQPPEQRDSELDDLLGQVPFLNGGLFDVHDLERDYPNIEIPDEAFERVFEFFDGYRWHLDERPHREDNEINPDVLGYIFEKYINQKDMGAYYTKEDITGYISRNTVIPFLFDEAKKKCPVAFEPDGGVWGLLRDDPDRYIYPAVAHGLTWDVKNPHAPKQIKARRDLPPEITAGIDDVSKRDGWNAQAPENIALPTETWREVVARRQRYEEVRAKLTAGEVSEINDLITLNLDIERFAVDVIAQSEGPELLRAFWQALYGKRDRSETGISVLDPTCGSGAFLFAALNILEPLYTACLKGMQGFVDDLTRTERPHSPAALSDFHEALYQAAEHPSESYFILKSIVLHNLYGVDIMEEAVEICKLRLFLKLVAQLESYDQIEPLPDIDFNIRAGNTLVGFASLDAVRQAMRAAGVEGKVKAEQGRMLSSDEQRALAEIEEQAEIADRVFRQFREQQTRLGGEVTLADKVELRDWLQDLDDRLDRLLAGEYGIDAEDADAYSQWRTSHQPFHWFVEFYGIMSAGGFDVIVGNPPYVQWRKIDDYSVREYRTERCPDIYAACVERSVNLSRDGSRVAMIVPLSLTFSRQFAALRALLQDECASNWFSSFGRIPSALFSFDTRVRNTIWLGYKSSQAPICNFTSRLHRWFDSQRPALFDCLSYSPFSPLAFNGLVPKLGSARLLEGLETLLTHSPYRLRDELDPVAHEHRLHFKQTAYNWLTFCVDQPPAYDSSNRLVSQTKYGTVHFLDSVSRNVSMILQNGKLVFAWWIAVGDDFDLTQTNFASSPFGPARLSESEQREVLRLLPVLEEAMSENLVFKLNAGKNIGNYNLARCRNVTDQADQMWLEAVGLGELWEEFELEHSLVVRTSFDDQED